MLPETWGASLSSDLVTIPAEHAPSKSSSYPKHVASGTGPLTTRSQWQQEASTERKSRRCARASPCLDRRSWCFTAVLVPGAGPRLSWLLEAQNELLHFRWHHPALPQRLLTEPSHHGKAPRAIVSSAEWRRKRTEQVRWFHVRSTRPDQQIRRPLIVRPTAW